MVIKNGKIIRVYESDIKNGVLEIPGDVKEIGLGDLSFPGNEKIVTLTLNEGTTKIGKNALSRLEKLKNVSIPLTVTEIGEHAFAGCKSLESVTIPDNVTKLGKCAFMDCKSLKVAVLSKRLERINLGTFKNCESLKTIKIPDNVTSVGDFVFLGCKSLKSVTAPDAVLMKGEKEFRKKASIDENVKIVSRKGVTEAYELEKLRKEVKALEEKLMKKYARIEELGGKAVTLKTK